MGCSRGGLTTKIHAVVDALGRPIRLMLTAGQVHDSHGARELLVELDSGTVVVGDKAYDADWIRDQIKDQGAIRDFERFLKNLGFMVLRPRRRFSSHTTARSDDIFVRLDRLRATFEHSAAPS
jgi:transposase